MRPMTEGEWRSFLTDRPRPATVATVRKDGRPHVAPVWFDLDGDKVVFTTWHESAKARTIRHDNRVVLCVDDARPPFTYVTIEGTATLSDDAEQVRAWAARLGGRYMGHDRAEAYGDRNGVPGELLVRVKIARVVAHTEVAE